MTQKTANYSFVFMDISLFKKISFTINMTNAISTSTKLASFGSVYDCKVDGISAS